MPRGLRRKIFYVLILAFVILGAGAVSYAQGWRLTIDPIRFSKVGAIYLHTAPEDATVTLNGKEKKRNLGIFDKSTLISNLPPDQYELEINAPGYEKWKMTIGVSSSLVTALPQLVLVPKEPLLIASSTIKDPNIIVGKSEDGNIIISYATTSRHYILKDVNKATTTDLGTLPRQSSAKYLPLAFTQVPGDPTLFVTANTTRIDLMRIPGGETLNIATGTIGITEVIRGKVFWSRFDSVTHTSWISSYDLIARTSNLNFDSIPGTVTDIAARDQENIFILNTEGSLYSLNNSNRVLIGEEVRFMSLSGDGNTIGIVSERGLRVLSLKRDQPDLQIYLPDASQITGIVWYRDNTHLFVYYPERVAFLDILDTKLQNFLTVIDSGSAEYDPAKNILRFIKGGSIYGFVFPK